MISFSAKKRGEEKAEQTRAQGLVPAIVYGPEIDSVSISVEPVPFSKLYEEAASSLIELQVEGSKDPLIVLIQDVQYDPVKRNVIHVDFRQIKMGEEMSTTTSLVFVGESSAVKQDGGTLMTGNDYINIKCLPKDLVNEIEIDLSVLKTFDDTITIADLKLPEGIVCTDNADSLIAKVSAPLTEDQLKAMEEAEAPKVEDVEVEGEDKDAEGGEAKEGEEKKDGDAEGKKEEKK